MKNRPFWHGLSRHFFEAHRLRAKLKVVVFFFSSGAVFVFNGIGDFIVKLDDIRFADQTQVLTPKRQGPFDTDALLIVRLYFVHPVVHGLSSQGIKILIKGLLDMNQGALPGTVAVVLQRGNHDGVVYFVCRHELIDHRIQRDLRWQIVPINRHSVV